MRYFGVPTCPYCRKRVNLIRTWSLKRQGEYQCPRCGGISNIFLSPLIYVFALLAIFAAGSMYFFHKFILDDIDLETVIYVVVPFGVFFLISLFMVYLEKPVIKKVSKAEFDKKRRLRPVSQESQNYQNYQPTAGDYSPRASHRPGPIRQEERPKPQGGAVNQEAFSRAKQRAAVENDQQSQRIRFPSQPAKPSPAEPQPASQNVRPVSSPQAVSAPPQRLKEEKAAGAQTAQEPVAAVERNFPPEEHPRPTVPASAVRPTPKGYAPRSSAYQNHRSPIDPASGRSQIQRTSYQANAYQQGNYPVQRNAVQNMSPEVPQNNVRPVPAAPQQGERAPIRNAYQGTYSQPGQANVGVHNLNVTGTFEQQGAAIQQGRNAYGQQRAAAVQAYRQGQPQQYRSAYQQERAVRQEETGEVGRQGSSSYNEQRGREAYRNSQNNQ